MKKILIVEDEGLVADDIAAVLEEAGYTICGIADKAEDAIALFKEAKPNLVICDIFIKGSVSGIELAKTLSKIAAVPLIYLTASADHETLRNASQTFHFAYLVKPFTKKQLVAAADLAMQSPFTSHVNETGDSIPYPTDREIEILSLLAKGLNTRNISEALLISEHTVHTHRKNMMRKYKTVSAAELIALAVKLRWITP